MFAWESNSTLNILFIGESVMCARWSPSIVLLMLMSLSTLGNMVRLGLGLTLDLTLVFIILLKIISLAMSCEGKWRGV